MCYRRNADRDIRIQQRRAVFGDIMAEARYLNGRERAGVLHPYRITLAASLNYPTAVLLRGEVVDIEDTTYYNYPNSDFFGYSIGFNPVDGVLGWCGWSQIEIGMDLVKHAFNEYYVSNEGRKEINELFLRIYQYLNYDSQNNLEEIYLLRTTQSKDEFYAKYRPEIDAILKELADQVASVKEADSIIRELDLPQGSPESHVRWAAVDIATLVWERGGSRALKLIGAADHCRLAARDQYEELEWQRRYLIKQLLA